MSLKKIISYGGNPRSSSSSQSSVIICSGNRSRNKERVKSAPLGVPQIEQQQHLRAQQTSMANLRSGSQLSKNSTRSSSSALSPTSQQQSDSDQVIPSENNFSGNILLTLKIRSNALAKFAKLCSQ